MRLFFMEPGGISTFGEKKERHQRLFLKCIVKMFFAFPWITFGKSSVNAAAQWSSPQGVGGWRIQYHLSPSNYCCRVQMAVKTKHTRLLLLAEFNDSTKQTFVMGDGGPRWSDIITSCCTSMMPISQSITFQGCPNWIEIWRLRRHHWTHRPAQ